MPTFVTKRDAIEQDLLPALGDHAGDFDVNGLADAAYSYYPGRGFVHATRDAEEFWTLVTQFDRTA